MANPPTNNQIKSMHLTSNFHRWLSEQPATTNQDLIEEVLQAYGLGSHVLDRVVAEYFAEAVRQSLRDEFSQLRAGTQITIQKCFLNKPPTSFRDIDEAVEFGAYGYYSSKDFKTLTGRRIQDSGDKPQGTEIDGEEETN